MPVAAQPAVGRADLNRLARAAASAGLPGTSHVAPDRPLDDATWEALVELVQLQRSTGPFLDVVLAGTWPATTEQHARLLETHPACSERH